MLGFLRFNPIAVNLWAVERDGVKIAEIALNVAGPVTLIPVDSFAYSREELANMVAFMGTASTLAGSITEVEGVLSVVHAVASGRDPGGFLSSIV